MPRMVHLVRCVADPFRPRHGLETAVLVLALTCLPTFVALLPTLESGQVIIETRWGQETYSSFKFQDRLSIALEDLVKAAGAKANIATFPDVCRVTVPRQCSRCLLVTAER